MKRLAYFYSLLICLKYISAIYNLRSLGNETSVASYPVALNIYNDSTNHCVNDKRTRVRKCCDVNYILNYDDVCVYNNSVKLRAPIFKYGNVLSDKDPSNSVIISGWMRCVNDSEVDVIITDIFHIQENGRLWFPYVNKYFHYDRYCLDFDDDLDLIAHMCLPIYEEVSYLMSQDLSLIGKMISLPFLAVTFLIYAILPLRNFHGKCLMCYVASLFLTYLLQVCYVYYMFIGDFGCRVLAMIFLYFFDASFFWMNVMCIDIWLTFSGSRGFSRFTPGHRRFLSYSAYAWGVPLLLVISIVSISNIARPYTWYNPGLTYAPCGLSDGIPMLLYYYLPRAALIIANIVLFILTTAKIKQTQNVTYVLRKGNNRTSTPETDKQRFQVYLKLFLVMGVNWSVEVISWVVNWQIENAYGVWYVASFFNAVFGVCIFFLFVFKRSIWRLLKQRCCSSFRKEHYSKRASISPDIAV